MPVGHLANAFLLRGVPMSDHQFPRDALFIKLGWFQAGAFGRLAIIVLGLLIVGYFAGKAAGWW